MQQTTLYYVPPINVTQLYFKEIDKNNTPYCKCQFQYLGFSSGHLVTLRAKSGHIGLKEIFVCTLTLILMVIAFLRCLIFDIYMSLG